MPIHSTEYQPVPRAGSLQVEALLLSKALFSERDSRFRRFRLQRSRSSGPAGGDHHRERRLELLIRRLPRHLQTGVRWLRRPATRWVRIPAGLLLIVASLFSILPILGLWMLPLGLVLLAEDVPPVQRVTDRILAWIERKRPHGMGLPASTQRCIG